METTLPDALELANLARLMELASGSREVAIGLVDGPVAIDHPDLSIDSIRELPGDRRAICARADSVACTHGTFVAGILNASRRSAAPAICPGCTLLLRAVFGETTSVPAQVPSATPEELAAAIVDCIDAGARLINVSAALTSLPSAAGERALQHALDHAAHRGVIVVAAAGNQGLVGSTVITRHPWVIAVIACDRRARPLAISNLGSSIGRRGLSAPGDDVTSLAADGGTATSGGTSVAAPFVTGAIALVWSRFPEAGAAVMKMAVAEAHAPHRRSVVPALLDAWSIYSALGRLLRQQRAT